MANPDLFANNEDNTHIFTNEELPAKPSIDHFNLRELEVIQDGQEVIGDLGATENVNGDLYALFDFKSLEKPISVQVATDRPSAFITGTGTLKCQGINGMTISVKMVYYFEKSRSNLLSIAAFKKSGVVF